MVRMIVARRVRFYGDVQGVNFRRNFAALGNSLKLVGWVKNLADGSVEAHIEGEPQLIQSMIHRSCTELFPAKVEKFQSQEDEIEELQEFVVIR
ncbi:MAG: acylphosphatase [Candidatus Thermoplasmatota archaeon]|jgi:acylphosphatase|nr:acylphosphatase [Candidatus Thermoplasmatota archaeon]MCL5954831.1 acylphosphatase [Candidatus Thermoplasmatota archaeon]